MDKVALFCTAALKCGDPEYAHATTASWLSLAMLPPALLILLMARQWVRQPRRKRSVQTNRALGAA